MHNTVIVKPSVLAFGALVIGAVGYFFGYTRANEKSLLKQLKEKDEANKKEDGSNE